LYGRPTQRWRWFHDGHAERHFFDANAGQQFYWAPGADYRLRDA
jgi:hypothetical protein